MSMSSRARRMERHHKRNTRGQLNLVSLMDIFTILVFFLLVNSSESEVLERNQAVQIPESIAEQKPRQTVVVMVTPDSVLVQGQQVATIAEVSALEGNTIEPLQAALREQVERLIIKSSTDDPASREVTIMGDKSIPYSVLKKVMTTCTQADYGHISLAVLQKGAGKDSAAGSAS